MKTSVRLRKIFSSGIRLLSGRRRRKAPAPVEGVAEGITFETLNEVCLQHLGEPLAHVSHMHLSGWKAAGSHRLLLRTRGGRRWRLIYKRAIYQLDHIPALAELPITPGPPEYVVYSNACGELTKYLPTVYLCSEVVPGRHYKYLLEDLSQEYRRAAKTEAILSVAAELSTIHQTLNEWSLAVGQDGLLEYGLEFSVALQEYVRKILERYAQRTANTAASEVCELWPQISEVHRRKEFHRSNATHAIHGDLNPSNILIGRKHPDRIKLVDWEWSGLGVAHADLASLLKGKAFDVEQQALSIYSRHDNRLSLDEHRRLYQWCQLERGLLDAAFCAAQVMELPSVTTKFNLPGFVERAMQRVLRIYQELV